jgi:pimeloyl-ACP methyl ester carboxylesterase
MSRGFPSDRTEWGYFDKIAEDLNEAGRDILRFDFSGSGESYDDTITVEKEVDDLDSAIRHLEGQGLDSIGLYGHSLGGLVSLRNNGPTVDAMVLTSPVTAATENYGVQRFGQDPSFTQENGKYVRHMERGPRSEIKIDPKIIEERRNVKQEKLTEDISTPVLIVHGEKDNVVPLEDSRSAVQKLENSKLEVVQDLTHDYDTNLEQVSDAAVDWFNTYLNP